MELSKKEDDNNRITNAIDVLVDYALEAPHHKNYGYAQALKILMGDERYNRFLEEIIKEDKEAFEGVAL